MESRAQGPLLCMIVKGAVDSFCVICFDSKGKERFFHHVELSEKRVQSKHPVLFFIRSGDTLTKIRFVMDDVLTSVDEVSLWHTLPNPISDTLQFGASARGLAYAGWQCPSSVQVSWSKDIVEDGEPYSVSASL